MKSVGEAMAIGRSFAEALQKGMRSMETELLRPRSRWSHRAAGGPDAFRAALSAAASLTGCSIAAQAIPRWAIDRGHPRASTKFDPWFLRELKRIVDAERADHRDSGLPRAKPGRYAGSRP